MIKQIRNLNSKNISIDFRCYVDVLVWDFLGFDELINDNECV